MAYSQKLQQPLRLPPVEWFLALLLFLVVARTGWEVNIFRHGSLLSHRSDAWGYYQFLPALLGTHEWSQLPWSHPLENGNTLGMFTVGVAWLLLPFFLMGSLWAMLLGLPVDGYSMPFEIMQYIAAAFYLVAGCMILTRTLQRLVGRPIALLTPWVLFGATNLFFYSTYEPGTSHVYCFFLFALLLHLTLRMLEQPTGSRLFLLIVCGGLLVLIRQMHVIALLLPLFLGSGRPMDALHIRMEWLRAHPKPAIAAAALVVLLFLPQFLYWHHITGQFVIFTYGHKGEGFQWTDPHLLDVLVSHQNGWFIYTPLMALVMVALGIGAWRGLPYMRTILLVWVLVWIVYSSWWSWWLGGSFGYRGFIEHYAFLAIPLAVGLRWVWTRGRWWKWSSYLVLYVLVFINIRLSDLYLWPWEGPDWNWHRLIEVWRQIPDV